MSHLSIIFPKMIKQPALYCDWQALPSTNASITLTASLHFGTPELHSFPMKLCIWDYCGLQEWRTEHSPILIDWAVVEQIESFKFLGVHHQTNMLQKHQDSREEGTTKPIAPQEIWHGSSGPQKVLQLHHREHPDRLHHCLVWQLLVLRPQDTTEGSVYSPVHHWGQASCHPGPLYQAVSEEGPKNCQAMRLLNS